jgi:hypothetical protein
MKVVLECFAAGGTEPPWRSPVAGAWAIRRDIERHQKATESFMEAGVRIIELSQRLHSMFVKQPAHEKRRLLDFVVSNCSWKDGRLFPTFRQPFDMLAVAVAKNLASETVNEVPSAKNENWLPGMDSNHELDRILKSHNLLILQSR